MVTMTLNEWTRYRDLLKRLSDLAAGDFRDAVFKAGGKFGAAGLDKIPKEELIDYAYALVQKYGTGAAEAACEWYDAIAELSGANVDPAEPAEMPDYGEVAKAINGTLKTGNEEIVAGAVGRQVKLAGQDTTLQNAMRDSSLVAWMTTGDTCAYCLSLSAMGWVNASEDMLEGGHTKHIHPNCDCFYAVKFDPDTIYEGYNYEENYKKVYQAALDQGVIKEGEQISNTKLLSKDILNATRREAYDENSEEINSQKRSAYAKQQERESARAEEVKL